MPAPTRPTALYGPFSPGQHVGFETVQTVLTVNASANGDTLAGPFTVQFVNLDGQALFAAGGTVSGKRLKIEPLATPCGESPTGLAPSSAAEAEGLKLPGQRTPVTVALRIGNDSGSTAVTPLID